MKDDQVFDLSPTIQAWAEIVIKEFDKKMSALGIRDAKDAAKRFEKEVRWAAGGDQNKIEFMFGFYLKFVDWGVGNGVSLDARDALVSTGLTSRRKKPWFTAVFYKELATLRHIISERTRDNVQLLILQNIQDNSKPPPIEL